MKRVLFVTILCLVVMSSLPGEAFAGEDRVRSPKEASDLPPARRYAGEILAYLLEIALGRLGDPAQREAWQTRGLNVPLPDLAEVEEIMRDTARNELALMVLDSNLRFLTRVLYHYDPRLSLHKSSRVISLYPAPEFVALRLLLLQKVHRKERLRLGGLMRRPHLLSPGRRKVSQEALQAVGLRLEELRLIRDIVAAEPHLYGYLSCPFLVQALWRIGVVEWDDFVRDRVEEANYQGVPCGCSREGEEGEGGVRIAVLPSMTTEFEALDRPAPGAPFGFLPTEHLLELEDKLVEAIRGRAGDAVFCLEQTRPLVIHPENAEKVIADVCPNADFVVILTGKNLYLPMHIDEDQDVYPHVPRIYLDILDLEYDQGQEQVEAVAKFIRSRLQQDASGKGAP